MDIAKVLRGTCLKIGCLVLTIAAMALGCGVRPAPQRTLPATVIQLPPLRVGTQEVKFHANANEYNVKLPPDTEVVYECDLYLENGVTTTTLPPGVVEIVSLDRNGNRIIQQTGLTETVATGDTAKLRAVLDPITKAGRYSLRVYLGEYHTEDLAITIK